MKVKRIDRVYEQLVDNWENSTLENILTDQGNSAQELADQLEVTRSNTSLELNKLVREQKVVKVKQFPVKYVAAESLLAIIPQLERIHLFEVQSLNEFLDDSLEGTQNSKEVFSVSQEIKKKNNPFDLVIGHRDSLKKAISQAKAAVYYPPFGLHMLLLGPTGSGKTFFANRIYEYARYENILDDKAPFESFNCADYSHNPQLLMSQLFGFCKGAFTGATEDHPGLVEKANGGILLLDEIHRLPPEGQEMLFYFIDNGSFNRLGESGIKRQAKVLIICATTENPTSTLLATFLRRIPMTITIPPLKDRSIKERVQLMKFLFRNEAKRIEKTLRIHIDVLNALLHTTNYGNVGQLKAQIQLVCAQAFLAHLHRSEEIDIRVKDLPEEIRQEWLYSTKNIERAKDLSEFVDVVTLIQPEDAIVIPRENFSEFNIYESIEEKVAALESEGIDSEQIHQYILTDLHLHIRNFVRSGNVTYNLDKFVDQEISALTSELKVLAEKKLNCRFDRRFNYYIGMHIDAFFKRGKNSGRLLSQEIEKVKTSHSLEYQVALLFREKIRERLDVELPELEVVYLTMLISSIETLDEKKKVSVLVVAHGNSTATSMVEAATELLGNAPIEALDMPLSVSPNELFERLSARVKSLESGKGILMLVDMGSLAMLGNKLEKATGSRIRTIPNVTTAMVLDVVRKVNYMDMDLSSIYASVRKDFLASVSLQEENRGKPKVILSICTTGQGTAKKLEKMLTDIIYESTDDSVSVLSVSALRLAKEIPKIVQKYQVIASVGTKNPHIDSPHISLEALIEEQGESVLRQLLNAPVYDETKKKERKNIVVRDLCEDTLKTYLIYLNPYHVTDMLIEWSEVIQEKLEQSFSNSSILKLVIHTAFAFERVLKKNELAYKETISGELHEIIELVTQTLTTLEEKLDLKICKDEKVYIAEIILEIIS
ncbi:sigma 54-interacting transcriptional regulator [Vagococcus entomophilus]|uniref:sigma 54-interacting transcriptional regulator n=1 Tax=Vagococcus entomophilus TaxID=1160095 RepID=UPI0026C2DAF9